MDTEQVKTLAEKLEQLIDSQGLSHVLHEIERVCSEKADHIAENWQDNSLSQEWQEASTKIGLMADSINL